MVITRHGDNYFKIQSGDFTVLVDPANLRSVRGANLILNTKKSEEIFGDSAFVIDHQGEYQIKDAEVRGWDVERETEKKTIYRLTLDEINILILGQISKEPDLKILPPEEIDIVIIPAGGKPYLNQAASAKLVKDLEPSLVIPAFFKDIKPFLKELGKKNCETTDKLTIKKKDLTPKAITVNCLNS